MKKKEYLLFILNDLQGVWPLASHLIPVIERIEQTDKKLLNDIFEYFKKQIKSENNKLLNDQFKKSLLKVKSIQQKESKEKETEIEELDDLEKQLDLL